jgi:hypothetical protein
MIFLAFLGCGEVTTTTAQPPAPSADNSDGEESDVADLNHPTGNTAVVLGANFTDPVGTLSLLPIDSPRTPTKNLQKTHSDAVVRSFGGKLYVVNRLGADNIQVVDPAAGFEVVRQFSVGLGTNPQQIIVIDESKAYVTLYQPEDNRSDDLAVDDLLVVNPSTGTILKTIDLTPFAADDGERFARASAMVVVGGRLFVAVQDLPGNLALPPNQQGKIVVLDTETDRIVGSLILFGRDPIAMDYSDETGKIYVADAYFFDLTTAFGGIEAVDPASLKAEGMVVDDLLLGGTPGDIEVRSPFGFVVLSSLDPDEGSFVARFGLEGPSEIVRLYEGTSFIQEIAVDENGLLLVGDRAPEANGILFIDPESGDIVDGPINTGPAPSSITFIDR